MVEHDSEFPCVLERAIAANVPALIELRVDPEYIAPDKTIADLQAAR